MLLSLCLTDRISTQYSSGSDAAQAWADSVVTILLAEGRQANAVGAGLVVRADGYVLTAYYLVKNARKIQIRLRNC